MASFIGTDWTARVDAETHVGDAQAVLRRVAIKQRDSNVGCVILLLAATRHHRDVLRQLGGALVAQYPVSARRALAALKEGRSPAGNSIILL